MGVCEKIYGLAKTAAASGRDGAYEAYMMCLSLVENYILQQEAEEKERRARNALALAEALVELYEGTNNSTDK